MLTCDKCNASLEDEAEYCSECGKKVYETIYCPECGLKTTSEYVLCKKCGKSLVVKTSENLVIKKAVVEITNVRSKLNLFFSKKNSVIALSGVAVIIAIAVLFVINPFKSKKMDSVLYIKDSEINFTFSSNIKPFEITNGFSNSQEDLSSEDYAGLESNYNYILYNEDKNLMFYPDNIDDDGVGTYYLRNLKSDNTKPDAAIKVDSEISIGNGIKISKDGSKVFYIKGSDKRLYYNHMEDKEKIDSNVDYFYVNDKGDYIVYVTDDGTIYEKDIKTNKEKIESKAFIQGVTDDLNKIYYLKDDSLYMKERNKDKVKISSNVKSIVSIINSSGCYYTKEDEINVKLSDYVMDDLAQSDKAMIMPTEEKYQTQELVQDPYYDDYYNTVTDWDAYNAEYDIYNAKLQRDELRDSLSTTDSIMNNTKLYYYDGTKENLVSENIEDTTMSTPKSALVLYSKFEKSEVTKVKLSDVLTIADVEALVEESKDSSSEMYAAIKETETIIKQSKATNFRLNYSGTAFYYLDDYSEDENYGTLMEVKLGSNKLATPSKIDDDVNEYRFENESDSVLYFKDVDNESGTMYKAGKSIANDVMIYSVYSFKDSSNLLYFTDFSNSSYNGTLEFLKDGKTKKISDDVNSFVAENESNISYLVDYNNDTSKGDALLYNNSDKPTKIDYDVTKLLWKNAFIDFSSNSYNHE